MQVSFVIVASLLAVLGNLKYLRDVFSGKIQPHAYTWFVWTIVSCIVFFGSLSRGAGIGAIPILISELFTIVIFIFSLKNGFKNVETIDHIFLIIALTGLIPWYLTSDPTISVIVAVAIDFTAFIPTIRKTFLRPESENYILYITNASRHILILLSVDTYNIATTLHSIVMIMLNSIMTYLTVFKKRNNR
jgi:hypothetical protein